MPHDRTGNWLYSCVCQSGAALSFVRHKVHSTGHSSRLNRPEITAIAPFGSQTYTKEELTAELGAAYLCGISGISAQTMENSAAYIAGWMERLRDDKRFFFEAAQKAQRAANFIQNISYPTEE